jgi:hypothetical protein
MSMGGASNPADWFAYQLKTSAEGFAWAVQQIPVERRHKNPPSPDYLGRWPPARHAYHVYSYDYHLALPEMQQWLDGSPQAALQNLMTWDNEGALWNQDNLEHVLEKFAQVRATQIEMLARFDADQWSQPKATIWGHVSLFWVVFKTYQHTLEHSTTIMQMALFWDYE